MLVSLYTSRIVLRELGVEDYGIYNIVGGVVVLFSFLSSALTQATQRFLTIELGKNNLLQFRRIFSLSLLLYLGLSLFIILVAETIGLWFLNTQLNIAENGLNAANWVYQFSLLTYTFSLLQIPYNASIIAHEKMSFYAYMSILDVSLKLAVAYILMIGNSDKLILFSILLASVSFTVLCVYRFFCVSKYNECKYQFFWNGKLFKQLLSFSGWSMFGSMSVIAATQGINVLLNIFFGVVVNAAMGITNQVANAVNQFVSNFQIAFNPRITKSYAENDKIYLESLMFRSAKMSFYLLLLLSIPIIIKTETILTIWLQKVPEYTLEFVRFSLLSLLIDSLSGPLWMVVQATGKIKKYQLIISSIFWLNFIFSLVLFKLGFSPVTAFVIRCIVSLILLFTRLYLLSNMIQFKSVKFITDVVIRVLFVGAIAYILPYISSFYFVDFSGFIIVSLISVISTIITIYCIGLHHKERKKLNRFIITKFIAIKI
jgi:O-antigen/teichoic acid export membrane protein